MHKNFQTAAEDNAVWSAVNMCAAFTM